MRLRNTLSHVSWADYVKRISGDDVNRVIASKIGITEPSVARWKNGAIKTPDAVQAAVFARAYRRPVLEAFVAAGFLTAEEAGEQPTAAPSLAGLSDDELLDEVRQRMGASTENAAWGSRPVTADPQPPPGATRPDQHASTREGSSR